MIDLTNYEHRRGVVILSSKDMRTGVNALFDWKVHTGCAESTIRILKSRINTLDIDDSIKEASLQDCDSILKWIIESGKDIEKAREIFR